MWNDDGGTQGEKLNLCGDLVNNKYKSLLEYGGLYVCIF